MYDPAVGRFTGVDPIADKFAHITGYNYAENRVPNGIDLHGLQFVQSHVLWKTNPEMAKRNAQMHQQSRVAGGEMALGFTPVGVLLDIRDVGIAIRDRDAVGFGLAMLGFLPGGDIFKGRKILDDARKGFDDFDDFGGGGIYNDLSSGSPYDFVPGEKIDEDIVEKLSKDMLENGFDLDSPIEVTEIYGRNYILDGHHRVEAAKKAGVDVVYKKLSNEEALSKYRFRDNDEIIWRALELNR